MRSLLVFIHLVIVARLSDGAPVPTTQTLDCLLNNPNLSELERCVAKTPPVDLSDTTSQLSNGGAPAIGRNGVSKLANGVTSAADKDSLPQTSSSIISAAIQGDLSGISNVATTAADEEGVSGLLPEGFLSLFGVPQFVNKITSSDSNGGAGDSGSGGPGGSGGSGTTEGAPNQNGDPQAYAGTRYSNANGNTATFTDEPGYPSALTDPRDGNRSAQASNDGSSSNTPANGFSFHSPPYPDQRIPDTPGVGPNQSGAGASYARYPATLNPVGDAYVGYSSTSNTAGDPYSGYPSTSTATGNSYGGYPSTSKATGERNPTSGYPDAFATSAPTEYGDSDSNTDRYLGGTGGGRGASRGGDGDFGPLSRIASHQGESCKDKVACTDIRVGSNDGGKVETSPAVDWTSNVIPGEKTPEVKEMNFGCPDGDVNACVDSKGASRRG